MMMRIEGDRREHSRVPCERPCKIYDPLCEKYLLGATCDLSEGGLLIDLPRLSDIKPGDTLFVGVAMKRRQVLLHAGKMLKALVVRTMATADDHTRLAVKFVDASVAAASELRLAA
jgi:hypothetical protein